MTLQLSEESVKRRERGMAKLSVIMTVYNMALYLKDSIEAVLNQTYQDLELILVVDGGEDASSEICQSYAKQDGRIQYIETENRGTASARNTGLARAEGKYIGFIDADDWIEPHFYEVLVGALEETASDIAACGFIKIENRSVLKAIGEKELSELYVYSSEEAIAMTFERNKMRYSPCNKVYKRQMFEDLQYPVGVLYEDKATTYRLFHLADQIAYLDVPMYHYYVHQDSVMRRPITPANFSLFKVNEDLIDFLNEHYPNLVLTAKKSYLEECQCLLERLLPQDNFIEERERCLSVIARLAGETKS